MDLGKRAPSSVVGVREKVREGHQSDEEVYRLSTVSIKLVCYCIQQQNYSTTNINNSSRIFCFNLQIIHCPQRFDTCVDA